MAVNTTKFPARGVSSQSATARKSSGRSSQRHPSDDEILGLVTAVARPTAGGSNGYDAGDVSDAPAAQEASASADQIKAGAPVEGNASAAGASAAESAQAPAELAPILEANPRLRQAWDAAQQYQQIFATPTAARDAQQQLADLDGMFFSARPADHAALAARIHELSPEAFHSLAQAMQAHAEKVAAAAGEQQLNSSSVDGNAQPENSSPSGSAAGSAGSSSSATVSSSNSAAQPSAPAVSARPPIDAQRAAQAAFFHDTNAAAVEQVLGAVHSQVDHLLPDSVPAGTRNRIVGEIYRELDSTLRANRHLGKQLREAFQAGAGDAAHQRAIVTLVAGRARQALPAVAKRVIGEWTQSIVAANRERLGRHEAATKRVDISGAGPSDGVNRKPMSPRDINYRKLSDADILNL